MFTVDETGLHELFFSPDEDVAVIMEQKAYTVENRAKRNLLLPAGGGWYYPGVKFFRRGAKLYRWERFSTHRASAPFEPASSDSGQLLNSIGHTMVETDSGIGADIGSPLDHALYTEIGTKWMAPRPWLRPALDEVKVESE